MQLIDYQLIAILRSDPVGIRTQDPQLRRLLLYPAELPDPGIVGLPRFELGQAEPKSVVLPLHHKPNLPTFKRNVIALVRF